MCSDRLEAIELDEHDDDGREWKGICDIDHEEKFFFARSMKRLRPISRYFAWVVQ